MLPWITQLLLVLISTCLFSLCCFCLGWRHGLVEDRQTYLLLEAPCLDGLGDESTIRGIMGCSMLGCCPSWCVSRDETPCQRCRRLHCPAPAPRLTLHTTLWATGKMLSKRFPFLVLFYMFEGLHELATTLFQVLAFHSFPLESDYNRKRLTPKWELSSKCSDSCLCYATLYMTVLLCGCFQCTYCSSCPKRLCSYPGVSFSLDYQVL